VDQYVALSLPRTWRTAAIVAATVAALELVALIVIGVALLAKPLAGEAKRAALNAALPDPKTKPQTKPQQTGAPSLARGQTRVVVLNGNGRSGAAAAEAARVRARGYRVGHVGNASSTSFGRSIVMFRRGFRPEALRLARDLGIGLVGPLDGIKPTALVRSQLVLVVGG